MPTLLAKAFVLQFQTWPTYYNIKFHKDSKNCGVAMVLLIVIYLGGKIGTFLVGKLIIDVRGKFIYKLINWTMLYTQQFQDNTKLTSFY